MNKILSGLALIGAVMTTSAATPQVYFGDECGNMNGVSDNGRYAVASDEDDGFAYLWYIDNPEVFTDISSPKGDPSEPSGQRIAGTHVYDVSDSGMAVGSTGYADGHSEAAWYDPETGEWHELDRPANAQNNVEAVAVTPDGKIIAGYYVMANAEVGFGQYHPCQWILGADGKYELRTYEDIELPAHEGFYPMAQSPDGRIISGSCFAGFNSSLPALVIDGKLKLFNEITTIIEPFVYQGKYYCGRDDNNIQIWTDDPDDPRIVYYAEERIDGYDDGGGAGVFNGYLASCDGQGNFYGRRSQVTTDDYGNAETEDSACIYNIESGEWEDYYFTSSFTCGAGPNLIFTADNRVMTDENAFDINEYYGFTTPAGTESFGISKTSLDGKTLGGVMAEFIEAIGDYYYYPYVILTDGSNGVRATYGGKDNTSVIITRGHIEVTNADDATIYDMEGRVAASGTSIDVPAGTYVVKAGEKSIKAIVR